MTNPEQTQNQEQGSRILIVEDDERLATLTKDYLESNGLIVSIEGDGSRAIERIKNEQPDLVVLDLMLTARTEDLDQVLGLEMGADDYVAKPARPRVLLARIRALLRRAADISAGKEEGGESEHRLTFGELVVDSAMREAWLAGESIDLTSAEFDLLWLLSSNAGRVLTREEIFNQLRGIEYDGQDRSFDVRISRIRPKVGDDPVNPKRIKTVRSKGYLFVKEI